tara:strand:- start:147 stop:1733 length:1587 start_codon:yes stop_codon:yes gene_type:complete
MAIADATSELKENNKLLEKINDTLDNQGASSLQDKENAKEEKSRQEKLMAMLIDKAGQPVVVKFDEKKKKGGLLKWLLGAFFILDIIVWFDDIRLAIMGAGRFLKKIFGGTGWWKRLAESMQSLKKSKIGVFITNIFTKIKDQFAKIWKRLNKSKIFRGISRVFRAVKDFFQGGFWRLFTKGLGAAKKPAGAFSKAFSKWWKIIKRFVKVLRIFLRPLMTLMKVLAFPLLIIFAIIDAVKGFMTEYKKEGSILAGIRGALIGLIDGLVGWVIELGAWLLGWILEKLGFDKGIVDQFKNFDFFEWANNFVKAIPAFVIGVVDKVKAWVKENITDKLTHFLTQTPFGKKLTEKIKPFMDFFGKVIDMVGDIFTAIKDGMKRGMAVAVVAAQKALPAWLTDNIIPDKALKWLGLPTAEQNAEDNRRLLRSQQRKDERLRRKERPLGPDDFARLAAEATAAAAAEEREAERERLWTAGKYDQAMALTAPPVVIAPTNNNSSSSTNISTGQGNGTLKTLEQMLQPWSYSYSTQ